MEKELKKQIEEIAKKTMGFETLKERKSDSLDFKEVSIWSVEEALMAAYNLGKKSKN